MKGDSTGRGLHVGGAEVGEFVGEDRFESAGQGAKKAWFVLSISVFLLS